MKPGFPKNYLLLSYLLALLIFPAICGAQNIDPVTMEWEIGGESRKALVYFPASAKDKPSPIVFAFHGHGGTMTNMFNTRRFDKLWPECIFVCPQGLNTPGKLTDPEGKLPGWQNEPGKMNDRDLKFFDAMLETLIKDYKIDQKHIYATGHSNGGGFTYLLWASRGDLLTAVAPTATAAGRNLTSLKPKPVLHLYGERDPLVKTAWQINTCKALLKINGCDTNRANAITPYLTKYSSSGKNPVLIYKFPGGHNYPLEANQVIVDFFKSVN